jgi:dipeptidyl aminopeptidase/acylaminoacyl peptidase
LNRRTSFAAVVATIAFAVLVAASAVATGIPSRKPPPSGTIAFERDTGKGPSIWLIAPDGRRQREVETRGDAFDPAWTPTSQLTFVSIRSGTFAIYAAKAATPKRVTEDRLIKAKPAWSPNGRLVAFESGPVGHENIYIGSTGTPKPVTREAADDIYPSWSPDSKELVFSSNRDGRYRLYRLRLGKAPRVLSSGRGEDLEPRWAPDGTRIAFTRLDRKGNYDVWTIDPKTKMEKQLTHDPGQDFQPTWAPDSNYIAFVSNRSANGELKDYDIFVMDDRGKGQTDISNNRAPEIAPAWAPRPVASLAPGSPFGRRSALTCDDGTDGPDPLNGTDSSELICGKGGDDRIHGNGGNDEIYGQAGNDLIYGGSGRDTIFGGDGVDRIYGGPGGDQIHGGAGKDREFGGYGDDRLWSRDRTKDIVRGGPGAPGAALDVSVLRDPGDDVAEIP